MMENTRDLSKFGIRELKTTAELLNAYCENSELLGDGVAVEFNPSSGKVFLVDEDFNTAMLNDNKLELWHFLNYEGHEGFLSDLLTDLKNGNITHEEDIRQLWELCDSEQREQFKEQFKAVAEEE